jgi:AcrR family transcriptional regulator
LARTAPSAARQRILAVAADLFYRHGFHAVGVDAIVAQSGVAKMTLYRHFPSKDDLIAAYLHAANADFWAWFEAALATATTPREQLLSLFRRVAELTTAPTCFGCTFQNTAVEFPDPASPAHQVALAHKEAVRARLRDLVAAAGAEQPAALADQLFLLMDGAWMAKRMFGPRNPAAHLVAAAALLLDNQLRPPSGA